MRNTVIERRRAILSQLYEKQEVDARDLAREFKLSTATIRRDLRSIAAEGRARMSHGGAILSAGRDYSYSSKAARNVEAKKIIGRLAGKICMEGSQVFLDSGSTCAAMTPHLKSKRGLSVIVNSARLALELDTYNISVIMLGGQYRHDRMDTVGPLAQKSLSELMGYAAFIGTDGLDMEHGVMAADIQSAYLFGLVVENAREVILLADYSKFETTSLCRVAGWEKIDTVVTDRAPRGKWVEFFTRKKIEVICPETTGW